MTNRLLTVHEQEAWDEYNRVLDSIPNGRMYDRVSVMNAFPELQEAFDHCCELSKQTCKFSMTLKNLTKDYENE